jgi:hypothetical protein
MLPHEIENALVPAILAAVSNFEIADAGSSEALDPLRDDGMNLLRWPGIHVVVHPIDLGRTHLRGSDTVEALIKALFRAHPLLVEVLVVEDNDVFDLDRRIVSTNR